MTALAEKLALLRKKKGYKQLYIALILNVSASAYNRYEKGRAEPNLTRLTLLADLYGISLDELLGRVYSGRKSLIPKTTNKNNSISLSENLYRLRKKRKLKQRDLAQLLQVKPPAYNKYENKKMEPSIEKMIQLADFFQLTLDDLVYRPIY